MSINLETERLHLHPLKKQGIPAIVTAANLPEANLNQWLYHAPIYQNEAALTAVLKALPTATPAQHIFIGHVRTGGIATIIEAAQKQNGYHHTIKLGFWAHPHYQNQGYMTESLTALTAYIFKNWDIKRIECECAINNKASNKTAQKAGFTREGTLKKAYTTTLNETQDLNLYAKVKKT